MRRYAGDRRGPGHPDVTVLQQHRVDHVDDAVGALDVWTEHPDPVALPFDLVTCKEKRVWLINRAVAGMGFYLGLDGLDERSESCDVAAIDSFQWAFTFCRAWSRDDTKMTAESSEVYQTQRRKMHVAFKTGGSYDR